MNKKEVDSYRYIVRSRLEELTIISTDQGSDIKHIKEVIDEVKVLLKEQNGRVRMLESSMAGVKAIGALVSVIFSSLFGYLFTKG